MHDEVLEATGVAMPFAVASFTTIRACGRPIPAPAAGVRFLPWLRFQLLARLTQQHLLVILQSLGNGTVCSVADSSTICDVGHIYLAPIYGSVGVR
jgi:hypothetical protein